MVKRTLEKIISSTAETEGVDFSEIAYKAFDVARTDRDFSLRLANAASDADPLILIFNLAKLAFPDEE